MPKRDLDSLLAAYRRNPSQDDVFDAATRYSRATASRMGAGDAEDVAQRAVQFLWRQNSTITGSVTSWLRSVIRRLILMDLRAEHRRIPTAPMPTTESAFATLVDEPRPSRNPNKLTDVQLRVAAAYLLQGFSVSESAECAGLKLSSLRWKAMRQTA